MPRTKNEDQTAEDQVETNEAEVEVDEIKVAFDAALEAEKDEDAVKLDMITAGASFKNVTRLFNQYMIDSGLAISKEDKAAAVSNAVEGKDLATEEGFNEASKAIVEAIEGTTERSADAQVRAYAKKNELEVFAKPKATGTGSPRSGFATDFYAFLLSNPKMSEAEAKAFIDGEGDHKDTSDNVKKNTTHYMGIYSLVNKVANQ